jgi:hypothetical protein
MRAAAWLSDDTHRIPARRWISDMVLDSGRMTQLMAIAREVSFGNLPVTISVLRLPSPQGYRSLKGNRRIPLIET